MGSDEYHPISRQGTNLLEAGGIGYTVVDSIDTMLLMGLTEEYGRARSWVQTDMNLDRDGWLSNFEVCTYSPAVAQTLLLMRCTFRPPYASWAACYQRIISLETTNCFWTKQ